MTEFKPDEVKRIVEDKTVQLRVSIAPEVLETLATEGNKYKMSPSRYLSFVASVLHIKMNEEIAQ